MRFKLIISAKKSDFDHFICNGFDLSKTFICSSFKTAKVMNSFDDDYVIASIQFTIPNRKVQSIIVAALQGFGNPGYFKADVLDYEIITIKNQ